MVTMYGISLPAAASAKLCSGVDNAKERISMNKDCDNELKGLRPLMMRESLLGVVGGRVVECCADLGVCCQYGGKECKEHEP